MAEKSEAFNMIWLRTQTKC